ncbi:hypothetical protein B9Z55_007179 [Caenorhabditis nigoni]|uniref:Domain of unknown function WSN domain-containing protein n=1 Tax=Caenorhabditis nigoni TaxID=1611254 RepID=A0A2G5V8F2_9PELO|nr:hypothetical protein B9Z55_007179 [Caenorhabditis nigoni]
MWVLKTPLFLLLIDGIKSTKDSQFALDEYYQEASEIYGKANKIHLENELATGKIGALDVSARIMNKKIDASVLEEYLAMKISGGLKEQNEMMELFEKAKESETSEQLKDEVENGYNMMDGFSDLEKKISEFNIDGVDDYFKRLEIRLYSESFRSEIKYQLGSLREAYQKISEYVRSFQNDTLSDTDKRTVWRNIDLLQRISKASRDIPDALKQQGFNDDSHSFDSFERTRDVTEKLNAMMNEVKNMEGIDSKLLKVEKEMEVLEALREGSMVNEIKNQLYEEVAETTVNLLTLTERRYPDPAQVDKDFLPLFREFLNEHAWLRDVDILIMLLRQIKNLITELNLDNVRKVFEEVLEKLDKPKQFLECYSNLQTKASDMKELLVLHGKVWNFDPKVLESTVEVVGMFKEAYKMIEEIKKWKVATNPEIENFPLDGEDVKAVSDGINVLGTIRNVQNGLEMMKTLDVENLGIKGSWDLLDSSLSQFFEILSSQKIWNSFNVSFPTNLPIDTIKTFIEDEYQENQRNDILKFLKEIQILQTDFPEYPNKLQKMNEAIEKMNKWEDEKMNPVKTMVDCFEMECNASLKLPEASN